MAGTADLKFLHHKPRGSLSGTSDREAVL